MWLQGAIAVLQLLPTLVDTIATLTKKVEPESPVGGGPAQKEAVVGLVKASVNAADRFAEDGEMLSEQTKDAIIDIAGEATDVMVSLYNKVGTFKKVSHELPKE